jgi:preprotein translocase subunit SecG
MSLFNILLIVHVFVTLAMIGFILLQKSGSDGFGLGSGSGSNFMSGRQSANFMSRGTAILATVFMANSLLLSVLASGEGSSSIFDKVDSAPAIESSVDSETIDAAPAEPEAPTVPLAE